VFRAYRALFNPAAKLQFDDGPFGGPTSSSKFQNMAPRGRMSGSRLNQASPKVYGSMTTDFPAKANDSPMTRRDGGTATV